MKYWPQKKKLNRFSAESKTSVILTRASTINLRLSKNLMIITAKFILVYGWSSNKIFLLMLFFTYKKLLKWAISLEQLEPVVVSVKLCKTPGNMQNIIRFL